jgi:hypothetical protein
VVSGAQAAGVAAVALVAVAVPWAGTRLLQYLFVRMWVQSMSAPLPWFWRGQMAEPRAPAPPSNPPGK